jgi:hypothetical protein
MIGDLRQDLLHGLRILRSYRLYRMTRDDDPSLRLAAQDSNLEASIVVEAGATGSIDERIDVAAGAPAALATYLPARRASRVDPTAALRCD